MLNNFRPMLAGTIKNIEDLQQLYYPIFASPKLDGIRCLIHPELGAVSRTMKRIPNQFLWKTFSDNPALSHEENSALHYLDGELICGERTAPNVYQHTVSEVMTQHNTERVTEATLVVFDTFNSEHSNLNYDERIDQVLTSVWESNFNVKTREYLSQQGYQNYEIPNIEVLESIICQTPEDILRTEESYLQQGYEGIMLRTLDSKYKFGRSTLREQYLLKLKRFADAEATIIGYEPLQRNHNTAEKDAFGLMKRSTHIENKIDAPLLGNLIVRTEAGIEFSIGTGFTENQRSDLWNCRENLIGQVIKYKYQEVGVKDKPRFPVFLSFRPEGA